MKTSRSNGNKMSQKGMHTKVKLIIVVIHRGQLRQRDKSHERSHYPNGIIFIVLPENQTSASNSANNNRTVVRRAQKQPIDFDQVRAHRTHPTQIQQQSFESLYLRELD